MSEKKGQKTAKCLFFEKSVNKITKLLDIVNKLVLRSLPNDMEQLLKFSNLYLKPILS